MNLKGINKKLAIITTHPIQYYAPLFRLLADESKVDVKVFYTWSQAKEIVKDKTFGRDIKWDVPLLEGYDFEFVENISKRPSSNSWLGIDNPELISKIEVFEPDAILVYGWNMKSHFKVLRHFKGKTPVWFRGDSTLLDEQKGLKTYLRRFWLTYVYRHVDRAFYVGQANKAYFLKHGLTEKQLVYAPHAVNNSHFYDNDQQSYKKKAADWKKNLGISEDQVTVVFAGKFEAKKQPNLLIDAVIEANKKRKKPIKLLLIGNGPLEESLKEQAERQNCIRFLPFQNQSKMPLVYRLGSIFCLPSKGPGETWGLAVNEAMASSIPVIVTNKVGGAEDMLIKDYNGYEFEYSNRQELESILINLSIDKLKIMGANAKLHVENFTLLHTVKAIKKELKMIKTKQS